MPEEKKIGKPIKISGCIWGIAFLLTAAFWIVKVMLPKGMEYRAWAQMAGIIWSFLIMPLSFIVFEQMLLWGKRGKGNPVFKSILAAVSLGVFVIYFIIAIVIVWVAKLDQGKETVFAEGIIQTQTEYVGSVASRSTYEEPVGFFFKREYEPITDVLLLSMEKKYGESFVLTGKPQEGFTGPYEVCPAGKPEVVIKVQEILGYFSDDYSIMWAYYLMQEEAAASCPERALRTSTGVSREDYLASAIVTECNGPEDMRACAEDVAALIGAALQDDFFQKPGRTVKLVVQCGDGAGNSKEAYFYFGNKSNGRTEYDYESDRYTDADLVYKKLLDTFDGMGAEAVAEHEASPYFVEGAYKELYEEMFADNGYPYDCRYNAKGNFYAWLCNGEGELESTPGTFDYTETVVYDRESKNGKCHLFVHYRTYYQDGTEYTTAILDMYAVDMKTGRVYASGRHAWADVGNEAYREATGEP